LLKQCNNISSIWLSFEKKKENRKCWGRVEECQMINFSWIRCRNFLWWQKVLKRCSFDFPLLSNWTHNVDDISNNLTDGLTCLHYLLLVDCLRICFRFFIPKKTRCGHALFNMKQWYRPSQTNKFLKTKKLWHFRNAKVPNIVKENLLSHRANTNQVSSNSSVSYNHSVIWTISLPSHHSKLSVGS
jgi:hypothetical protein